MVKLTGNNIYLTRGDTMFLTIELLNADGSEYEPAEDDKLYFRMKKGANAKEYIIEKEVPIDTRILELEEDDTKDLKFTTYSYEVELVTSAGYHFTIIEDSPFTIGTELEIHGQDNG